MPSKRSARIFRPTGRNIAFLAGRLQAGELVAIPTETVYGLGGNALDANACARIFRAKARPSHDPLIVHIYRTTDLQRIARVNPAVLRLAKEFWPGPLTMVLPKTTVVPNIVTAGLDSVAVRMPAHPVARRFLLRCGVPVAAPSANPFGYVSPTTAEHVRQGLGTRLRYILDGGPCAIGVESTIVDLRNPAKPTLLRPGAITRQDLERTLDCRVEASIRSTGLSRASAVPQVAPGMLARHYSPRTPVVLHQQLGPRDFDPPSDAFVFMSKPAHPTGENVFWFDERGSLRGIARRLFATLRQVDALKFKAIHVERATGGGLADAINDRLARAAAR